jgi:hypothetical protein
MKQLISILILLTVFLTPKVVIGDSFRINPPEYNVRNATLILDVVVLDIRYEEISGVPFAMVRLKVVDRIVGESPEEIEIRRIFVTPDLRFLKTDWLPAYTIGERFITTLSNRNGNYTTRGLYNGKFNVEDGYIHGSGMAEGEFKQIIHDIRTNEREYFPASLPRQKSGVQKHLEKNQNNELETQTSLSCLDGTPDLGDRFRT